ncbi:hypothetical protein VC83_07215 [Pseudogymnoascus destructans]|uniref:Uncharacterized protein n=1 Tax=Pseudogymnoascus destructans TaxID=655981 RepID=A0A177A534_9PEZI|nr:uncharacterized protein VC83_07215 [Pseudogymnoascus destructans]OAF56720.1 hypothetical protein VC83_07215 [Pseudogymnoascus destructans]
MESVIPNVEDHTRPAVIAAKLHAMVICPVLFAQSHAKLAAIIRNAASYAMSHAHHVPKIVHGLVHIVDGAHYHVQFLVICYHAQSAVQRYWPVGTDVHPFVGRSAEMLRIARFVRIQQSRGWSLTLSCQLLLRRSILMRTHALYRHAGIC